jgi:hypothetical protein
MNEKCSDFAQNWCQLGQYYAQPYLKFSLKLQHFLFRENFKVVLKPKKTKNNKIIKKSQFSFGQYSLKN